MSNRTIALTDPLYDYLLSVSLREPALLAELRAEMAGHPDVQMQIAPEQGQFMALLVRLIGRAVASRSASSRDTRRSRRRSPCLRTGVSSPAT